MTLDAILAPIRALIWFFSQAVQVGGLGAVYFLIPAAIMLAVMAANYMRMDRSLRRRLPIVLLLPLIWILVGLYGGVFWEDSRAGSQPNPAWMIYPIWASMLLSFVLTFGLAAHLQGARPFVVAFGAINTLLTLGVGFMAGMAVTGSWL
ncbi:hypothetical protein [Roseiterribacter gracilis]|uniref:Uncharacterized protein n=1 Tax=Roseiterribacter gracilis TaxID=2812848 RepID=A0A8S8X9Z5_9PROT|nr:hypothetical protein TMPK1_03940 [Rhodospirillales bacterium TMPK1]